MGKGEIPCFDFSTKALDSDGKSKQLTELTDGVRDACETHGCFLVKFDDRELPLQLRHDFLTALVGLFDLPEETKKRYNGSGDAPFSRYERSSAVSEYFGIDGADGVHVARDFASIMWPNNDNPKFCEILNNMSAKMLELTWIVLKMVLKSFDIAKCDKLFEKENTASHFRLMKYAALQSDDPKTTVGLIPHTDKNFITILCQNDVQGLEVLSKEDGIWSEVIIPDQHFIVFLGDSLKAWSNGRFHSGKHRVITRLGTVRYSCALFLAPKGDATVEVSQSFVDEGHPILYCPFTYCDFLNFYASSNFVDGALELFAGV